jgi:membrane protease subunit HflK
MRSALLGRTKTLLTGFRAKTVPEARGRAAQIIQNAEAYREQTVAEAKGAASRFLKIYDQYKNAPEVTRRRMYLETMERLFGGTGKIIMDSGATRGIVPYLPLDQLTRRPQTAPQTGGGR